MDIRTLISAGLVYGLILGGLSANAESADGWASAIGSGAMIAALVGLLYGLAPISAAMMGHSMGVEELISRASDGRESSDVPGYQLFAFGYIYSGIGIAVLLTTASFTMACTLLIVGLESPFSTSFSLLFEFWQITLIAPLAGAISLAFLRG